MIWLALAAFFLGLPLAGGTVFYFSHKQSTQDSRRLAQLAQKWELELDRDSGRFRGTYQDRNMELYKAVQSDGSGGWKSALGLRVELAESSPHRGYARCARRPSQVQNFEQAFPKARMGLETLTDAQKSGLTEFVRQYGCLFFEAEKAPHRLEFTFHPKSVDEEHLGSLLAELDALASILEAPQ